MWFVEKPLPECIAMQYEGKVREMLIVRILKSMISKIFLGKLIFVSMLCIFMIIRFTEKKAAVFARSLL